MQCALRTAIIGTLQLGDIRGVKAKDLPEIDLLIGGSPCQGFSFSGKGLGLNDPRSALFFEYIRLLDECKPKYFLLENVRMNQESKTIITSKLGVEPVDIDSRLFSAQKRGRLYWTNIPIPQIIRENAPKWGDVRERGVSHKPFYYSHKAMQYLGRISLKKDKPLAVHLDSEQMQMVEASHFKKYSNQRFFGIFDIPSDRHVEEEVRVAVSGTGDLRFSRNINDDIVVSDGERERVFIPETRCQDGYLRYITPRECERLQTVPDDYTASVSNTQRYKMLGNGWTVDVISHIFGGIEF